ncbi:MAG: histidine phosphatase family protein, partial [Candidatus Parcubacteria bacterium]|nr:histidine phosphatase family protein [Candidatus Parcubacteria bacterium]
MSGQTDVPLTDLGIQQAEETATKLTNDYSLIFSSDLTRCKQTTDILNREMKLPVKYDKRLRERHYGSLEGKKFSDVDPTGILKEKDIVLQTYDYRPYDGESFDDVKNRLFDFITDIQKDHKNKKVLVVTHGGIIRVLHKTLKEVMPEKIHNASMHEFEFPDKN